MDEYLRRLQRRAAETGSEEDLQAFLNAAYRSGYYRKPRRKEIQKILRKQRKAYGGQGMMFSPRMFVPDPGVENMNASGLQHPDEVSDWDGSYAEWDDALKTALPGETFEVSTYYRAGPVHSPDWNLADVISMNVPSEVYKYGDNYYGPPPEFTRYRNPRKRRLKKPQWDLEPHQTPVCPPFCPDISEDEEDELRERDITAHYPKAKSFRDLIKLNIDFLRGERASPRYYGSIHDGNPESIASLRKMIQINKLGLLTIDSQPGEVIPKYGHKQRPYITGVANLKIAHHLYEVLNHHVIVTICPLWAEFNIDDLQAGAFSCGSILATYDDNQPFTHVGAHINGLQPDFAYIKPALANKLLDKAWAVNIVDPVWGRDAAVEGHLLDQTIEALNLFSGDPYRL